MVEDNEMVNVRNLVDHKVVFKDEDTHRRVVFNPFEVKKLPADMLRRLNYNYGGNVLLREYLCVDNDELAKEFGVSPDTIEYKWTSQDIDDCLLKGSLDQLLDALDFGPDGIRETLASRAVQLRINDVNKREAIKEKTGRDVSKMISLEDQYQQALKREKDNSAEKKDERPAHRRSATSTKRIGRRVTK